MISPLAYLSSIGRLWQMPSLGKIIRTNSLFIIMQIGLITLKFSSLPSQVPLYFSLPWGPARLVSAPIIFILPILSLLFLFSNLSLAAAFLKNIPLFSYLLTIFSFIFSSFSFIALLNIIGLLT